MQRVQTINTTLRLAVANEVSSLRYVLMITSRTDDEDVLLRGWDAGVAIIDDDDDDDDDGT
jgi:hypothetical protein